MTGNIILFAIGTGNYDELICMYMILRSWCCGVMMAFISNGVDLLGVVALLAVRDTLEAIIDALVDMTKSQSLSDLVLFQHYFVLVHILDEVCKEVGLDRVAVFF